MLLHSSFRVFVQRIAALILLVFAIQATPVVAQNAVTDDSLYQALGAKEGIKTIVDDLLQLVVIDERIKKQFVDADMQHLAMRLNEQFCALSGGPCQYGGKDMKLIHAELHITNAQFNALAEDLQIAMDKSHVPAHEQNRLLAKLAPMQRTVVTK